MTTTAPPLLYDFSSADPERANRARERTARAERITEQLLLGTKARHAQELEAARRTAHDAGTQHGYVMGVRTGLWLGFVSGAICTGALIVVAMQLGRWSGQ